MKSLQDAAKAAWDYANRKDGSSKQDDAFYFARAVKSFEVEHDRRLDESEYPNAFSIWWAEGNQRGNIPPDADFDGWLGAFIAAYERAKYPLFSNALENAIQIAPPLSEKPTFAERLERLIFVCRELQEESGKQPFFIGFRDAGRVMGTKDPYAARNALALLRSRKIITLETKGTAAGRKASRYKFGQT